jgi:hypothetical protein
VHSLAAVQRLLRNRDAADEVSKSLLCICSMAIFGGPNAGGFAILSRGHCFI